MTGSPPIPIAIIGMSCRLPGDVCDTESLWDLLIEGKNTWSSVPPERFNETAFYHPHPGNDGTTNHRGGHFLSQNNTIGTFDAGFFGLSAAEAEATDPQQRLLLEVSYEAFENAGIPIEQVRGSNTAVYAAMFTRDYDRNISKDTADIPKYHTTGCGEAIMSNRISYVFDLNGPSMTLDTGCSGSMVALHQACQSLRTGESSAALACGVNLILSPDHMIGMSNLYMLNDNGRSYPFDARGAGYGRGEGVTVVLLKRLDDALEAGDNIRAVIRSTAVNQDGKTNGITLPSQTAQEALQRKVFKLAGMDPTSVQYVEAHGTGTTAGDLAELQGIAQIFCKHRAPTDPVFVGSIKSNIGHLESSSGLAGLIKTVLMLERGYIVPNADFREPKPELELEQWRMRVPQELKHWPELQRASVNSFGYGGVNAHAILERAPVPKATSRLDSDTSNNLIYANGQKRSKNGCSGLPDHEATLDVTKPNRVIYPLSGYNRGQVVRQTMSTNKIAGVSEHGPNSVRTGKMSMDRLFALTASTRSLVLETARRLHSWTLSQAEATIDLDSLAYTLFTRRSMHQWRHIFQASSRDGLLSHLNGSLTVISSKTPRVLFIFTGQGAQWYAMGRELRFRYPTFRDSIHRSEEILQGLGASWNLSCELDRDEKDSQIHQSEIAQPSSTALQIALVDLLASFDVKPSTVIGYSSGEIAAAYAAGTISHETALRISFSRSLLSALCQQRTSSKGAMLSVGLGEHQVSPLLLETNKGVVCLACINSPSSTTISGDEPAIVELQARLNGMGVFNRKLEVDTAYHSHHMRKVADDYSRNLGTVDENTPHNRVTFISSVTATRKNRGFGANYWVGNLVSKVRFSEALEEYCRLELASSHNNGTHYLCIELGPHGTLAGPTRQTMAEATASLDYTYLPTLMRNQDAAQSILSLSGRLFEHGYSVNIENVNCLWKSNSDLRVLQNLPTHSWDHSKTYWHESRISRDYRLRQHPCHDLLGVRIPSSPSLEPSWRYIVSLDSLPWLADHVVDGIITFPGAGYVCMAIEASKQLAEDSELDAQSFVLHEVKLLKALVILPTPGKIELQICFRHQKIAHISWHEFRIYVISQDHTWHEHCRGRISARSRYDKELTDLQSSTIKFSETHLADSQNLSAKEVYGRLEANGNLYGPRFAGIKDLLIASSQAISHVAIPDIQSKMPARYQQPHIIHPATLDALLHTALPLYDLNCGSGSVMPIAIEELTISSRITSTPGSLLKAAVKLSLNSARSASADFSVSDSGANAREQPVLVVSNMELLGNGDLEQRHSTFPKVRALAHELQWVNQTDSKVSKNQNTTLMSLAEEGCSHHEHLVNTSSDTNFTPYSGINGVVKESVPVGYHISLIAAQNCSKFAAFLTSLLEQACHNVTATTWDSEAKNSQTLYLILDDSEHPFLESPTAELFRDITKTVHVAAKIFWVSTQVRPLNPNSIMDPKSALVTGFSRSACAELEQLKFITLDIQDHVYKDLQRVSVAVANTVKQCLAGSGDSEYVYRDNQIWIPRLVPDRHMNECLAQAGDPEIAEVPYLRPRYPLMFDVDSTKYPNGSHFVDASTVSVSLKSNEVEVEVLAHSFDLRHVDRSTRQTVDPVPIICEFAGTVRAIGGGQKPAMKVGDAVIGWNMHGLAYANYARSEICNIARIPKDWPLPTTAAMVLPLMASYYCLIQVAQLREGHSILIQGAASLYGQVAIAMARSLTVEVFVTVSTVAQRDDLVSKFDLPSSHVLFDTDIRLQKKVFELTAGRGVDAVLAVPSKVPMPDLNGCVTAYGVYVKILLTGETAHITPTKLSRSAITYVSFDMETIALHRPEKLAHILGKAVLLLLDEAPPLTSVKCMPLSKIEDAHAELQIPQAPEKVVLTADATTRVRVLRGSQADSDERASSLRPDAAYVIAGGLGDLGKKVAVLMAKLGAKHLVLLSRRSLAQVDVESLERDLRQHSPGLKLYTSPCDITEYTILANVRERLQACMLPPVRGIVQSATVLHDRVLERMTAEDWQVPLQTKMYGTRNLCEVFGSLSLDFVVMLSSLSGLVGTRGQANYAAGNTYQDAFAHRNVDSRTAYIALDLGMIEDSSAYENKLGQLRAKNLLRQGWIPIKSEQLTAVLKWALVPETWQRGSGQFAIGIDGASILEAENPTPTMLGAMFTHLRDAHEIRGPAQNVSPQDQRANVASAESLEDAKRNIINATHEKVSSLMSVGMQGIDHDTPLQNFGLDSLAAIEVKNFVRREFEATIHASEILDEPSLVALSNTIVSRSEMLQRKFGDRPERSKHTGKILNQEATQETLTLAISRPSEEASKLPALPLPSIKDTLDLYLTSTKPFLDAEAFERTSSVAQKFETGPGKLLQNRLESLVLTPEIENWQYNLHISGIYLRRRSPVHPFGTFYGVHHLTEQAHSQAERAAIIGTSAFTFKTKLEANELERDYLNEEPLCTQSLNWLFNACREPARNVDKIRKHEGSDYLVAIRRGHTYKIALEGGEQSIRHAKLRSAFEYVLGVSTESLPSIATLTADERDSWADIRGMVKSLDITNDDTLRFIEAAAFVVCLDDSSPVTPTERCNSLLLGDPRNRWTDKSLQFVVCANGVSGYICEHSMLDAASLRQINEVITTAIIQYIPEAESKENMNSDPSIVEELKFKINDVLMENIDRVHKHVDTAYAPIEFAHFKLPSMGSNFLRKYNMPSKAGIQTIIQLASLLFHGVQYPSWETLTVMLFRRGRSDWIQSVSPAMLTYCAAAFDESIPLAQRFEMLRQAASIHASTMTRISRGRGFLAHLEALQELAQQDEILPAFFEDPSWERMRVTSSRKLKTDASEGLMAQEAGFFMPDPDSVFVHYEVEEEDCRLFVQSTEGRTGRFCEALEKAAEQTRRLLEAS